MNAQSKQDRLLAEITEANVTYLTLAQRLLRDDRADAVVRLGIDESVADLVAELSAAQITKIARSNMLVCQFQFADDVVWDLITSNHRPAYGYEPVAAEVPAAVLMRGGPSQSAGLAKAA